MMERRDFLAILAGGLLTAPPAASARQMSKVWKIGYLDQGPAARNQAWLDGLREGLRSLGWVEDQNIALVPRFAEGRTDQLPRLAAQLVQLKMDIIVTSSTPAALAAKRATTTIPIVIGFAADPVGSGIVASLAHPGGNVTGWTHQGVDLRAKYLELLKEAVPRATRFGVLWNPMNPVHKPSLPNMEAAARRLNVELQLTGVADPADLTRALSELTGKGIQALVVLPDGMFLAQAAPIVALTAQHRLPTIYGLREYVPLGGLMAYGADIAKMHRQFSASLVDRILRGAKPGDLPIEQPTEFDLVINLRTAKTLGVTIPPLLLAQADQVIQ